MAEAALLSVAKSVLEQLGSPALKEFLLLWNAKKDLKRLENTTNNIVNILHDAERRESTEERVKGWLSRLRAVLYDIEDFFDVVAWRALHKQTMNGDAFRKEDGQWVCDNIPWSLLPSLRWLDLWCIENLGGIPDGIQHLTSLQRLAIFNCRGIKTIPVWMINLKSLQHLHIAGCSAEVKERCKPETGADWHLISHIPDQNHSDDAGRAVLWATALLEKNHIDLSFLDHSWLNNKGWSSIKVFDPSIHRSAEVRIYNL